MQCNVSLVALNRPVRLVRPHFILAALYVDLMNLHTWKAVIGRLCSILLQRPPASVDKLPGKVGEFHGDFKLKKNYLLFTGTFQALYNKYEPNVRLWHLGKAEGLSRLAERSVELRPNVVR